MAAGQQKKRSKAASVMRFSLHDNNRGKKTKKLEASDVVLNMTPRVSLEWDDSQNVAVAKRDQVGITWRDMVPFLDPVPQLRSCLADVFSVPQEIFVLESITDLLSYEVWETYLSKQEKKLLTQFLPRGVDVDHAVRSLLAGENLHFGNPVSKWGASLCAGNLHPDAVVQKEQWLRANRNTYFIKLKNYHTEMIERLSKLKKRWTNCKDPQKEIGKEIVRNGITKPIPPVAPEQVELSSCFGKEHMQKSGILYDDSIYMSYFKISKKQHKLVTSIMHAGDGIPATSLRHVLGDIEHFNIQSYAAFEVEERKRLHEHWSQLVNKDLTATFENLKEHRLLVDKWRKSLHHELAEVKERMDKKNEKGSLKWPSLEQVGERDSEQMPALDVQDEGCVQPVSHFTHYRHLERISSLNSCQELNPSSPDQDKLEILQSRSNHSIHPHNDDYHVARIPSDNNPQEHNTPSLDQEGCVNMVEKPTASMVHPEINGPEYANVDIMELEASPSTDSHDREMTLLGSCKRLRSVDLDEVDLGKIRSIDGAPVVWQFLGRTNTSVDVEANAKHSISCSKGVWLQRSNEHLCHHSTSENQAYASGEFPCQKPQAMGERVAQMIDLEAQMSDQGDAESVALHVDSRASMFNSYANQDHSLLLSPFHNEGGMLPHCVQEHLDGLNKSEIPFAVTNDGLMQSSQFPLQFGEQQEMLLEQQQLKEKDLYMRQILHLNVPSSGRFPSQDHYPTGGSQDWTSQQSPVNGGLPGQNWLHRDNCSPAGWSGAEFAGSVGQCFGVPGNVGQCFGDRGSIDGNLFGVLSGCNKLLSSSPYINMRSEHFPLGASFGSRGSPYGDGIYRYPPLLNDSGSRDAAASNMNSMTWTNFCHQNPGLPESFRKLYLPSWNH